MRRWSNHQRQKNHRGRGGLFRACIPKTITFNSHIVKCTIRRWISQSYFSRYFTCQPPACSSAPLTRMTLRMLTVKSSSSYYSFVSQPPPPHFPTSHYFDATLQRCLVPKIIIPFSGTNICHILPQPNVAVVVVVLWRGWSGDGGIQSESFG